MSLATTFQVGALTLSALFALIRLPMALRGRNPQLFWALVMLSVAIALGISPVYLAVDPFLGGNNVANLIIRFAMYGFVLILGLKAAKAFRAQRAHRLIAGPVGKTVIAGTVALTTLLFVLADMPVPSPGLRNYGGQWEVAVYGSLGRAYPAYVAACLIGPAASVALHRRRPVLMRTGSALLGMGLAAAVLYAVLDVTPLDVNPWDHLVPYSAVILATLGLVMLFSQRVASKRREKQNLLTNSYVK